MSGHDIGILGSSHLAETLELSLMARGMEVAHMPSDALSEWSYPKLVFIAEDVYDHTDTEEVTKHLAALAFRWERMEQGFWSGPEDFPTCVLLSQVPLGFVRPWAEKLPSLYYQVDTIIMKRALERMVHPEQIIVGGVDANQPLPLVYQEYLLAHECEVRQMNYESAELTKCAINYFLAMQVKTTTELAMIAERINANWTDIAEALKADERIGPHAYLKPGKLNTHLTRDVLTIRKWLGVP